MAWKTSRLIMNGFKQPYGCKYRQPIGCAKKKF
jgi:hypothetical protein